MRRGGPEADEMFADMFIGKSKINNNENNRRPTSMFGFNSHHDNAFVLV
jgi:hypothetical protein